MFNKKSFGLVISYTENLGDDIQSLASFQFLPKVDLVLDRDRPFTNHHIFTIFNGWYTHEPWSWLPGPRIVPLFISMHLAPFAFPVLLSRHAVREVLTRFGPVGTRDFYTLGVLKSYGIPSYFSGCLTLTLDYGFKSLRHRYSELVLVSDLLVGIKFIGSGVRVKLVSQLYHRTPVDYINSLPRPVKSLLGLIKVPYALIDNMNYRAQRILARRHGVAVRLATALQRIAEIASASLVITSRLHVALPALAFDVPVIFVHENLRDPRFWGLTDFMNVYTPKRFRELAERELDPGEFGIPNYEQLQALKTQLVERVKEFVREG